MQQTTLTAATTTTRRVGVVIGLDLDDRWSRYCFLNDAGAVLEEDRLCSHAGVLPERLGTLPSTRVVIETGTHLPWVSRLLASIDHSEECGEREDVAADV